ncbi:MAG: cyclic nucleotide-binding domain-containing protein [Candidatus Brocadiae bacterium]|nr:cyclic nucleotide-binding domain-containing protein [Candidatus Brocadiia bacterium]
MEIRKFLREVDTFSVLADADIEKVAALCRDRSLVRGEVVYAERDPGDRIFIVESGAIEIAKSNGPSGPMRIAVLEHGEIFGELAVFEERPRTAIATATRDSKVKVIEKKDLEALMAAEPALSARILRSLLRKTAARLRLADEAIQTLIRSFEA